MTVQLLDPIQSDEPRPGDEIAVWDIGVRLFHWSLVIVVATALATGFLAPRNWIDIHVIAGTVIAALLLYRIVWGFLGSTYARFGSFVVGPITAVQHAFDLARGRGHRHVGHNPVGTMMILGLLAAVLALTVTGVLALAGVIKEGPLAPFTSYTAGNIAKEIHELLAFGLLGLIGLHLIGVVMESLRTRENLVRGMVNGRKHVTADDHKAAAVEARPMAAGMLAVISIVVVGAGVWHWSAQPALGVPMVALDPLYVKECSACHTAHHPSLAPTSTWNAIMAGLGDHFGDNATLEPAQADAIAAYLFRNSAQAFDTKAANRLRMSDPAGSSRLTETPGWKRLHRHVDAAAFKQPKVAGKLNCAACHGDAASGRFNPRSIAIPKEN